MRINISLWIVYPCIQLWKFLTAAIQGVNKYLKLNTKSPALLPNVTWYSSGLSSKSIIRHHLDRGFTVYTLVMFCKISNTSVSTSYQVTPTSHCFDITVIMYSLLNYLAIILHEAVQPLHLTHTHSVYYELRSCALITFLFYGLYIIQACEWNTEMTQNVEISCRLTGHLLLS